MTLLSIGDEVRPGTYRFHSRFNRAVNFEDGGRLISVVDETIGPGPVNIVLRNVRLAPAQRRAGPGSPILKGLSNSAQGWIAGGRAGEPTLGRRSRKIPNPERVESHTSTDTPPPLQISTSMVLFEGHRYHFTSRHRYDSALEFEADDLRRFRRNLSALGEWLKAAAPPKSLAFLLDSRRRKNFRTGFDRAFAEQIRRGVRQVFHGYLLKGIRQLKGCGLGLTPAGDDFIAGLLIGLHLLQSLRGQNLQPAMDAIFRAARGDNLFSNIFLELARRGLLFGRMKDLLVVLHLGGQVSVRSAAEALFAIGESSGADLATGLVMTLRGSPSGSDWAAGQKPATSSRIRKAARPSRRRPKSSKRNLR